MSDLVTRAQLELLATLLEVDIERVRQLERLGVDGLKQLRRASRTTFSTARRRCSAG